MQAKWLYSDPDGHHIIELIQNQRNIINTSGFIVPIPLSGNVSDQHTNIWLDILYLKTPDIVDYYDDEVSESIPASNN